MTYKHGTLENEVLKVLWRLEEADEDSNISVGDVFESINNTAGKRAYTTIKTVMDRLVDKNMLVRYKSGRKFCYRSVSSRNDMAKKAIERLAKQYFNDDMKLLIQTVEKECLIKI